MRSFTRQAGVFGVGVLLGLFLLLGSGPEQVPAGELNGKEARTDSTPVTECTTGSCDNCECDSDGNRLCSPSPLCPDQDSCRWMWIATSDA